MSILNTLTSGNNETGLTIPVELAVGDTVSWTPSGTYTNWKAEYYSDSTYDIDKELYSGSDATTAGATTSTNWSDSITKIDMTISSWKVLDIDTINNVVRLVPLEPTVSGVKLCGAQGYNNAVKLLNDACSSLYGSGEGITARSINMTDLEGTAGDGSNGLMSADTSKISEAKGEGYPAKVNSPYTMQYSKYPKIYEEEALSDINGTYLATGIGMNDSASAMVDTNGFIPRNISKVSTGAVIQPSKTYYTLDYNKFTTALGETNAGLILPGGSNTRDYWLASRCIDLDSSACFFAVRRIKVSGLNSQTLSYSYDDSAGQSIVGLFPIVSISSGVLSGTNHSYTFTPAS